MPNALFKFVAYVMVFIFQFVVRKVLLFRLFYLNVANTCVQYNRSPVNPMYF